MEFLYRCLRQLAAKGIQALILMTLVSATPPLYAAIPASERQALINLYNSTNGAGWGYQANWTTTPGVFNTPGTECNWWGIVCDAGQTTVQTIDLEGNHLTGSLPDLSAFTNLQFFYADRNSLTGPIPSIGSLKTLQVFSVYSNHHLTGPVPSIAGLTNLQTFLVGHNQLTGSIPSLAGMTNLQVYSVGDNQLTGTIPSLTGLTNLQTFSAYQNQLTGEIPSLTGLTNLQTFWISGNQLSGSIPSLSGLTNLQYFAVDHNLLSGMLPTLSQLNKLQVFYVSNNQLSGQIPLLAGLTSLQDFEVDHNLFTGSPPSLTGLANLSIFDIQSNQLSGSLPTAPSTLNRGDSNVCPNSLTPTPDPAWDMATGVTPWYLPCVNAPLTVTPNAGLNGTISPNTPVSVESGRSTAFTVQPNAGFATRIGGTCGPDKFIDPLNYGNVWYETNPITTSCTVVATFIGPTTTTLTSSANPATAGGGGSPVLLTAAVKGDHPSGTVTFQFDGVAASPLCDSVPVSANFVATCSHSFFWGTYAIKATYSGDSSNLASTGKLLQIVNPIPATTWTYLQSSANPSLVGQGVTFTARVVAVNGTGTVTFADGGTTICDAVTLSQGVYSCTISSLTGGSHTITATYSGDSSNAISSASLTQNVNQPSTPSAILLVSSTNPIEQNQAVRFQAVIAATNAQGSPTGFVTFTDAGTTLCGAVPVRWLNNTYSAYCVARFNDTQTHSIAASYSGDASYAPALSAPLLQSVRSASPFNANQFGITGSWYNAATSGQGLEIEVLPDYLGAGKGVFFAGWFTYDAGNSGAQRWYTLQGAVDSSNASANLNIFQPTGGNFNSPPKIGTSSVGTATMVFADCTHATLNYMFTDGSGRSGSIPLTRLLATTSCTAAGDNSVSGTDYFLSGAWYDAATSGQGIVLDISPSQTVLAGAWYTYAKNGQNIGGGASQRWFTIQTNSYLPGSRSAMNVPIYSPHDGVFDDPTPITNPQVGSANITFPSCSAMNLSYTFTAGELAGQSGTIAMTPVGPAPKGCQ